MTDSERFWAKVDVRGPDECWEWTGTRTAFGYGGFRLAAPRRMVNAHRWVMGCERGDGKVVRHHCDNPPCVNPAHLAVGTYAENSADAVRRGRHRSGRSPGAANGNAVLTEYAVKWIRSLYDAGHVYQYELAEMFGVSQQMVSRITRREAWGQ